MMIKFEGFESEILLLYKTVLIGIQIQACNDSSWLEPYESVLCMLVGFRPFYFK